MDTDAIIPSIILLIMLVVCFGSALIAMSITENTAVQKMAIENRCEFNVQTSVWEHCKGPTVKEIK